MANITLLDIAKHNGNDAVVGMIEESISAHPEIALGDARTISGTSFKSLVRTTYPAVGFRDINEGVATANAVYEQRTTACKLIDCSSEVDAAAEQASDEGLDTILAREMDAKVESAMRGLSSQFYYGIASTVGVSSTATSPAKGFPGLVDLYDTTNMEVDGAGSSGTYTSVWLVKFGPKYVQWVVGNDGLFNIGETQSARLADGSFYPYDGFRKAMTFWVGLHGANPRNAAVRIKKLDTSATLSDTLLAQAVEKFAVGVVPDVVLMTRRSLRQLKTSRSTYNPTGDPSPWPSSIVGLADRNIPIMVTDAISQSETS